MEIASPQIRNVATVGGNLSQHSRCWYFRHRDTLCLKKGGDLCYARNSENRYHSLFTGNDCISPVVSSLATTFAALDATAVVLRDGKETRMSMAELYQKAWKEVAAHNSLNPGDLILRVEIPTARSRSAYMQVSDKHAFDWALVSCAAAAEVADGKLKSPRVALGSISPVPHQVEAANQFSRRKNPGRRHRVEGGGHDSGRRDAAGTQRLQGAAGARARPPHAAQTERRRMSQNFCKHLRTKKMFIGATPEEAFADKEGQHASPQPFLVQPHPDRRRRGRPARPQDRLQTVPFLLRGMIRISAVRMTRGKFPFA